MARISDRFMLALGEALRERPYEFRPYVQLRGFHAMRPGEEPARRAWVKVDYLLIAQFTSEPVLAIRLSNVTYGRDRRRSPEWGKYTSLTGNSIITVLDLDPHEVLGQGSLGEILKAHLP